MNNFQTDIQNALSRLIKAFPSANNTVGFELEHDGQSGFKMPAFFATSNQTGGWFIASTPDKAVTRLFRAVRITRVEEYIRSKAYQA